MSHLAITLLAAVIPSLILLWYFYSRDKYPEPPWLVWTTFGLGFLMTFAARVLTQPILVFLLAHVPDPYLCGTATAFIAGCSEELLKFSVLYVYCMRRSEFDEPMDGLVYGVSASLGFAAMENYYFVAAGGLGAAVLRAFTTVPGHAAFGAVMGYYVGKAHFAPRRRRSLLLKAWVIPMLMHALGAVPLHVAYAMKWNSYSPPEVLIPLLLIMVLTIPATVLIVAVIWSVRLAREVRGLQNQKAATQ